MAIPGAVSRDSGDRSGDMLGRYPSMYSIEMKWGFELHNCRGYRCLYIVQKAWTKKGPRNVRQISIGTANKLYQRLHASPGALSLRTFPFGKNAAFLHAGQETGFLRALEENLPVEGRLAEVAARLIFVQVLGRVEQPQSRRHMGRRWYPRSGLPLYWPVPHASDRAMLAALRLLFGTEEENEDGEMILTRARVRRIEEPVLRILLAQGLDLRYLLFDGTNSFTDHRGVRGKRSKPGRSKDRRYDKRLTGLALVTAGDIPILSELFPGNEAEPKAFHRIFDTLVARLVRLEVPMENLLAVFDYSVSETPDGLVATCAVPAEAEARLRASFGKTALITDLPADRLSDSAMVEGYLARSALEDDFKWLKDRGVMSVKPMWVSAPAAVRGHVFLSTTGLMLYRYLQWTLRDLGLSMQRLVETLDGIRIGIVKTEGGAPQLVFEQTTPVPQELIGRLKLTRLLPQ
jgi:hypothetical protein